MNKKIRHFLAIDDLSADEIMHVLELSKKMKDELKKSGTNDHLLQDKTMLMIFEKPSLRTRISFEIGMTQLGGHAIYLGPSDIGLGKREPASDVGKVGSSMADIIMARTFKHETIVELAGASTVPVINALSDKEHPCQILADLMTVWEYKKTLKGLKIAFVGDGNNNVTHSLAVASGLLGIDFSVAAPKQYWMAKEIVKKIQSLSAKTGMKLVETDKPEEAVQKADVVVTDTWVSMGAEKEKAERIQTLRPYQVTTALMSHAKHDAIFMHCLPAYRGNEMTAEVIDGPQSVAFPEAENRLHAQKGLIQFLMQE
ncbi:ornithine carbamoyltransferase [Candidatus Woesebacteria bacterium]|nr:ornithine carbamoyltransferase [Candidatus Woesebacteria bacterium]